MSSTSSISIPELRAAFDGRVTAPGDAGYEQARTIFYGGFDQRPGAIVRPTTAAEVAHKGGRTYGYRVEGSHGRLAYLPDHAPRLARPGQRAAGRLLVAGHDDGHVHRVEQARRLQRFEGLNDDDVAALHVDDAGPSRHVRVDTLELLEGTVALEHGIEVPDEEIIKGYEHAKGHHVLVVPQT